MGDDQQLLIPHDGVSGYSLDQETAEDFVHKGILLKKKIPISSVWLYFNAWSTLYGIEEEVVVNSDVVSTFKKDEIKIVGYDGEEEEEEEEE